MDTRLMKRLLAAALLAVVVSGCGNSAAKKDSAPAGPETAMLTARDLAEVVRRDVATGVSVQGTLRPLADVNLLAPFPDVIEEVLVKEGQAVQRGQALARMRMTSVAPAAASAEAQRRIAAADYLRMQNLLKEGAVAERDVENAEAQLRAAEAAAAMGQKRLDEATVRAPFAGVVAERLLQSGDRVGDGDQLFRIVNIDELEFTASVTTEALGQLKPGAPVALTVSGLEGRQVSGHVSRVNATVDQATRQVKVYVVVPNRDHRLAGDMFASGRIVLKQVSAALAVPGSGVTTGTDGTARAWVVSGGKLHQRTVTVGLRDDQNDLVEVRSGLQAGDKVVISAVEGLVDGQPVQLSRGLTPDVPAAPPAPPKNAGKR
jgi:membrane fusion protein (multidrug efflux system)